MDLQCVTFGSLLILVDGVGRLIGIGLITDERVRQVTAADRRRIRHQGAGVKAL